MPGIAAVAIALSLAAAAQAQTADLTETYNLPGRNGKAIGVVMLCPSSDGSYTARACTQSASGSSAAAAAINPVSSSAAESAQVLKTTAGSLYGFSVVAGATSGYVMVLDTASAPADGPVSPKKCYPLAAGSLLAASWASGPPVAFVNGITVVFSSTGCFTKTAAAAAFISGEVQ